MVWPHGLFLLWRCNLGALKELKSKTSVLHRTIVFKAAGTRTIEKHYFNWAISCVFWFVMFGFDLVVFFWEVSNGWRRLKSLESLKYHSRHTSYLEWSLTLLPSYCIAFSHHIIAAQLVEILQKLHISMVTTFFTCAQWFLKKQVQQSFNPPVNQSWKSLYFSCFTSLLPLKMFYLASNS